MTTRTAACWSKQQAAGPRIVPRPERMTMTTDQTTALYDAIDAFQRTHRLPGLQHAQIRGLLAEHLARALPAAVPVPPPTNRATLLREAAARLEERNPDRSADFSEGVDWALDELRAMADGPSRVAAEEQPAETQAPSCPDPIECGHEAALGLAEERLDRVRAVAEAWARPSMSSQSRLAGEHLLRVLDTDAAPAVVEQPDTQEAS